MVYDSNMSSLKKFRYELYKKVSSHIQEQNVNPSITVISEQAVFGEKYILVQKDNVLHRLNSSYSPTNEAEKWVKQFRFTSYGIVISLFGLGSGLFARELIKNKGNKDFLIIYEPSIEIFIHVLQYYDITDIIENKTVILAVEGINEFAFNQALRGLLNITNLYSQIKCTHPGYEEMFPEKAIYFWKTIKDNYIHERLNINTERVFGKRYISNALFNARYINDSIRLIDLKEYINTDIPAIIVAAGPSVNDNIEELRRAKGRAYIFVVDRILDYILDSGIEPDFIVTIDPIKPLEYFTKREDITAPLLCELASNYEVLNRHKGRKIIYSCNPYFQMMYLSQGKEPPVINTGASVATAAFSACVKLGFKRIVLVGQDLAYDGELTHAGGITEKIASENDIYVDGINGEKVRSRHDWYQFLNWFADVIMQNPDTEVIDTKTKGAKIKGAKLMSLKDVIDKFGAESDAANKVFSDIKSTFNDEEMEKIRKFFRDSYEELEVLKKKAKEAIQICEDQIRIYKNNGKDNYITEKNYHKLYKINEYISKQPVYYLLNSFITSEAAQQMSEMYTFTDDEIRDKIETCEKSLHIFRALVDGVEYAKKVYDENMEYI